MKKTIQICLLLIVFTPLVSAQSTENLNITEDPTSNWPFYFKDFTEATITLNDDKESITNTQVNINLFTGELQYLDGSKTIRILENLEDVKRIRVFGFMEFMFVDDFVQRIVLENETYIVTERKKANLSDLQSSSGAYGSSTASSAVDKINDQLVGGVNGFNYTSLVDTQDEGTSIQPELKYYLVSDSFQIPLSKRNVNKQFKNDAKKISSFIKKEKIDFKVLQDVKLLIDFLETL